MTHDEALQRVKKLLALSQSDNEHEAALAMGRAQALMERFKIETATLDEPDTPDEPIEVWDDPLDNESRSTWKGRLGITLSRANGCTTYKSGRSQIITGRASNVQTVRYLYRYCVRSIDSLALANGRGNGRTWINNYRLGCVQAIGDAIRDEREATRSEMREAVAGDSMALIRVDNAITNIINEEKDSDRHMRAKVKLVSSRGSSSRYNSSARSAGRSDGAGIYGSGSMGSIGAGSRRIGA